VKAWLQGALLLSSTALAEPPKLEALFPAGGQIGSSFVMSASGKLEADARLWTSAPGIHFVPNGKKREWQVTIAADAPLGMHLVHCANADGASEPRWFSVGSLPELLEVEPNDEVAKPQVIEKLPVCINARLDKSGDMDGYAVKLEAGQTLVGIVEAYSLGSGVDMLAHVMDEAGVRLHTASDSQNLDPVLSFKAPKAGRYIIQLAGFPHPPAADVRFTGSATMVYRLHLSASAAVTQLFPASVAMTGKSEIELIGHNLDPKKSKHTFEAKDLRRDGDLALVTPPGAVLPIQVLVTAKPAGIEKEPNNTKEQATPIQVGVVGGRISDKADVDRFSITMKKGDKLQARVLSKRLGLPLDALLKIEGPDGKLITSADDQSEQMPDPQAVWTAAVDGVHQIIVEDLFHQGGSDKAYVLEISAPAPAYEVTLADAKPITLAAGKTVSVKATVKLLNGFKEPLVTRVANLPAGVFAADVSVPEKGGEVEIKLQAATNAAPSGQPISISIWTKAEAAVMQTAKGPLRGESLRGTSLLDSSSQIWLTVK
jgi:hypothetical protein